MCNNSTAVRLADTRVWERCVMDDTSNPSTGEKLSSTTLTTRTSLDSNDLSSYPLSSLPAPSPTISPSRSRRPTYTSPNTLSRSPTAMTDLPPLMLAPGIEEKEKWTGKRVVRVTWNYVTTVKVPIQIWSFWSTSILLFLLFWSGVFLLVWCFLVRWSWMCPADMLSMLGQRLQ